MLAPAEKPRRFRTKRIHKEGVRGFRFGPKWLASVTAVDGIAVHPSNRPKLIRTAEKFEVKIDPKADMAVIASLVATAVRAAA